jgi:hypothetical protein
MDRRELGVGSIDQVKPFHCSINVVWLLVWVPTAVQEFSDVHDTPRRDRKASPGVGVACSDHFPARSSRACPMEVECQRSASSSVSRLASTVESPTAVQAVLDVHDVLQRRSPCEPRAGIRCRVHAVPFQLAAKGTCPIAWEVDPTAMQTLREVHETPLRPVDVLTLGVRWIDHLDPFQRSASAAPAPMSVIDPTL